MMRLYSTSWIRVISVWHIATLPHCIEERKREREREREREEAAEPQKHEPHGDSQRNTNQIKSNQIKDK